MFEKEENALLVDSEVVDENIDPDIPAQRSFDPLTGLAVSRRMSREMALRAAYVVELRACTIEEALHDPLVTENQPVTDFTSRLITQSVTHAEAIDDIIRNKIERWEFHRVAMIDRLVLRLAVAEMLYFNDIPPKVSMNEAIEIGKKFSTENSGRFINGVLDSIYGDMGRGEKVLQTGGNKEPV